MTCKQKKRRKKKARDSLVLYMDTTHYNARPFRMCNRPWITNLDREKRREKREKNINIRARTNSYRLTANGTKLLDQLKMSVIMYMYILPETTPTQRTPMPNPFEKGSNSTLIPKLEQWLSLFLLFYGLLLLLFVVGTKWDRCNGDHRKPQIIIYLFVRSFVYRKK